MFVKLSIGIIGAWTLIWSVKTLKGMSLEEDIAALRADDLETFVALRGMHLERHTVITIDHWRLEIHRIRNKHIYNETLSSPVMLSHGFGASSVDFMVNLRNESLAFILADSGFDVWAVNYRANRFSNMKSVDGKLRVPNSEDFYRVTWQYMAERDVPVILDKILGHTKQNRIHIIGQSMGSTVLSAFLSENHAYDGKIGHLVAISPVMRFGEDTSSYIKTLFRMTRALPKVAKGPLFPLVFGEPLYPVTSRITPLTDYWRTATCRLIPSLCRYISDFLFQTDFKSTIAGDPHLKKERMSLYLMKFPSGATMMNLYHFAMQFGRSPWTKMDYRKIPSTGISNRGEYSRDAPPAYDFSAINVSISAHFVKNDVFFGSRTAKSIVNMLDLRERDVQFVDGNGLNHIDTVWGWDARCFLYDDIIERLNRAELSRSLSHRIYRTQRVETHLRSLDFEKACS